MKKLGKPRRGSGAECHPGDDIGEADVVSAGGGNSKMFQMVMPWVLDGDDSHLKGPLRIAGKDMRFYTRMAENAPAPAFIAQAVNQVGGERNVAPLQIVGAPAAGEMASHECPQGWHGFVDDGIVVHPK